MKKIILFLGVILALGLASCKSGHKCNECPTFSSETPVGEKQG